MKNNFTARGVSFGSNLRNEFGHFGLRERFYITVGLCECFEKLRVLLNVFREFRRGRTALLHHILLTLSTAIETELTSLKRGLPIRLERLHGVLQRLIEETVHRLIKNFGRQFGRACIIDVAERDDGFQTNARMFIGNKCAQKFERVADLIAPITQN